MVLSSVTLTRPADIHWLYHQVGRYYPEAWERFGSGADEAERDGDLVAAYYRLLHVQTDLAVQGARRRGMVPLGGCSPHPYPGGYAQPPLWGPGVPHDVRPNRHSLLSSGGLVGTKMNFSRHANRLAGDPRRSGAWTSRSGRYPLDSAWQLARAWPDAELRVVETGHTGGDPMTATIVEATNRFATLS